MIPKIIHNIWLKGYDNIPNEHKIRHLNIKKNNPQWEFIIWDKNMIEKLLQPHHEILKLYNKSDTKDKIEIAKYVILKEYGGIYFDIDYRCISSLDNLFSNTSENQNAIYITLNPYTLWDILYPFQKNKYNSSFMALNKNHVVWNKVFAQLKYADTSFKIHDSLDFSLKDNENNLQNTRTNSFPIVILDKVNGNYYQCKHKDTTCYKSNSLFQYCRSHYKQCCLFIISICIIIFVEYLYKINASIYGTVNFIPGLPGSATIASNIIQKKKRK
jgi:hypothetical protein